MNPLAEPFTSFPDFLSSRFIWTLLRRSFRFAAAALLLAAYRGSATAAPAEPRVVAACNETYYRHSEGSAVELPDGRLLLVRSRFSGHKDRCGTLGDNGPATLVLAESSDGGTSWSEPRELPVGSATVNIMQAAFVPVRDRLMLAFSVRMKEGRTSAKYAIESRDNGCTWSPRRELFAAGGANDRAVRLSSGRILMPAHQRSAHRVGGDYDREVLVARSDDEGATWTLSAPIPHTPHAMESRKEHSHPLLINEPTVAECADGSALMLVRSVAGVLYRSRSADGGATWSVLEPTDIASFAAPPYLRKLKDGRLALLWNPIVGPAAAKAAEARSRGRPVPLGPRRRLALAISADNGQTWNEPRTLAEDGANGYCYPCVIARADGSLFVFCSRTPFTIYPCDLVQLPPITP